MVEIYSLLIIGMFKPGNSLIELTHGFNRGEYKEHSDQRNRFYGFVFPKNG